MNAAPSSSQAGPRSRRPASQRAPRGRWAPSPTGLLHIGNARTALAAWLSVRQRGGAFVWRVEDIDAPRTVAGMAEAAVEDLAWLGLDWDEDPARGGPYAPYAQSQRSLVYEAALRVLAKRGRLFPCRLSRRDLIDMASAPHAEDEHQAGEEEPPYPAHARPADLEPGWYDRLSSGEAALRFAVDAGVVRFVDRLYGAIDERVDRSVGDFVLKRRDGLYAYQLAAVVDDWTMEIDEVVRGADLLGSTARQIQLLEALGARRPVYAHVPLVVGAGGEKLSKRDASITLRSLREQGAAPWQVVGYLAWSLGIVDRPMAATARELVSEFSWSRIAPGEWRLPGDLLARLRELRRSSRQPGRG
ncbi:MAG: tRNA glutamyl-Q(34) synthetase GluQRS [Deltaproteobacteria bacterium]|nr:tRNA glutamyl-Q(34) synthetase GluQRS [Deltaproteobacteria bacterium]